MKILYPIKNGVITQKYGANVDFYKQRFGVNGHNGIDIVSFHGDSLFCPEDSVVVRVYGSKAGSVSGGFGLYLLGNPDENQECNLWVLWHTMSNICVSFNQEVKQGDVVAYEGASGQVYVNMNPVPDADKGNPPYPGTHLHWGNMRVKTNPFPNITSVSDINRISFEHNGMFFDILNQDNGFRGCVDPLLSDIIYFDDWKKQKISQTITEALVVVQQLPQEQQVSVLQKIIEFLKNIIK